jgi:hypothetical protein
MQHASILEQLTEKGADIAMLAEKINSAAVVHILVNALLQEDSIKKYAYEKTLRLISGKRPELIYPYFDMYDAFLDHENNFLKWGSIRTIANLTPVDVDKKFDEIFLRYYAPIKGPVMVTSANIIGCTTRIVKAKPSLSDAVVCEILKVEKARYRIKGALSPECRNVAIGHAIDAFKEIFVSINDKKAVLDFVKRQLRNSRKPVVKRAEKFLRFKDVAALVPVDD